MSTRQNVYSYPAADDYPYDSRPTLAGWYDTDRAMEYTEGTRWDGSNHVSLATGRQTEHERLHRTAGGRWVRHSWSQWQGSEERHEYITEADAREWLIRCEYPSDAIEEATGLPMPPELGRPAVGPQIKVRLPQDVIERVDELAVAAGQSRSEWVRHLVTVAVAE